MNKKMTLANLLKGLSFIKDSDGNIISQNSKTVKLCFLTTDKDFSLDSEFENPTKANVKTVNAYGQMEFKNQTDKNLFIPQGFAYITDKAIQDHGVAKGIFVKAKSAITTDDNVCVQSNQGGRDSFSDSTLAVLPISLLEPMFVGINGDTYRGDTSSDIPATSSAYGRTWHRIQQLNTLHNNGSSASIVDFRKKFDKQLSENVLYFEMPKNAIGFVVFHNDEIVIIDKFPSFTMTEQVKKAYFKDRYGALIMDDVKKRINPKQRLTDTFAELKKSNITKSTLELLKLANEKIKTDEQNLIINRFSELLVEEFTASVDNDQPSGMKLTSDNYVGHLMERGDFVLGMSLVEKRVNLKEATRKKIALNNLSKGQNDFKI